MFMGWNLKVSCEEYAPRRSTTQPSAEGRMGQVTEIVAVVFARGGQWRKLDDILPTPFQQRTAG